MQRFSIAGGNYIDALPTGEYCCLVPGAGIKTHAGLVPFPTADTINPLFLRCSSVGGFKFAGQGHDSNGGYEHTADGWRAFPPPCCGSSPVVYDAAGALHVSDCSQGSQGYRYVDAKGQIVTGDQTYYNPATGLSEWSAYGGLDIGMGHDVGGCLVWDGAVLRTLETGDCRFVRVQGVGENVAISFVKPDGAVRILATVAELRALPLTAVAAPAPDPIPVPVPVPVSAPLPAPVVEVPAVPEIVPFAWPSLNIIGGAPDVRGWAETTAITRVNFSPAGLALDFAARDRWPDVIYPGWEGPLQFTIWFVQLIAGVWTATGTIECWKGLQAAGGDVTGPAQFGDNWVYFARPPLHQPAVGETIGFFVTPGNQRRTDQRTGVDPATGKPVTVAAERSNFVSMPFPGAAGGTFTFPGSAVDPTPAPQPDPAPVPVPPAPTPAPSDVFSRIADILTRLAALEAKPAPVAVDLTQYAKHGDPVQVSGSVSVFGVKSAAATWTGKIL